MKVEQGMSYAEAVSQIPKLVPEAKKDKNKMEGECTVCKKNSRRHSDCKETGFCAFYGRCY